MTVDQMHVAVQLGLDKNPITSVPSFEPEEIDYFLNTAQERWLRTRFQEFEMSPNRTDDLQGLLSSIYLSGGVQYPSSNPFYNSISFDLTDSNGATAGGTNLTVFPNKYMFLVSARSYITFPSGFVADQMPTTGTNSRWIEGSIIKHNERNKYFNDIFNNPFFEKFYCYLEGNKLVAIYNNHIGTINLDNIILDLVYLRYPKKLINTISGGNYLGVSTTGNTDEFTETCELPEYIHTEIIDITVNLMLENIESNRGQTNELKLSQTE